MTKKAFSELKTQSAKDARIKANEEYMKEHHLQNSLVRLWGGYDNGITTSKKNGKQYQTFGFYAKSFGQPYGDKSHAVKVIVQVTENSKNARERYAQLCKDVQAQGKHGYVASANWSDSTDFADTQIVASLFARDQAKFASKAQKQADQNNENASSDNPF